MPSEEEDLRDLEQLSATKLAAEQAALATPSNGECETLLPDHEQTVSIDLSFLEPAVRSESLGRLGSFEVLESIAAGGMGIVFKARDTALQRVVAIKALGPLLTTDAKARQRFLREAQAAAAIRHPHVIGIHTVEETGVVPYLVMEYVEGGTLQQRLEREGRLGLNDIVRIAMQMALGLAAAHQRGLIHRDVKPGNILLEDGEQVKITDFGLAHAADEVTPTQAGTVAGTPQYMSPEQAEGVELSLRSDLFSLGVVLYAMCTGQSPFRADSVPATLRAVCDKPVQPVHEVNPEIPPWLSRLIGRLLAKHPEDRHPSAVAVADELREHWLRLRRGDPSAAAMRCSGDCGSCQWGLTDQDDRSSKVVAAAEEVQATEETAEMAPSGVGEIPRRRWRIAAALAISAAFLLWLGMMVLRTPDGMYILETDDPQIAAQLGADGGIVVVDRRTGRTYRLRRGTNRLPTGEYELKVSTPEGLELDTPEFRLTRGGRVTASIRAITASAALESLLEDKVYDKSWSPLRNLGPPLDTLAAEWGPHLTQDGLSLYFTSQRNRPKAGGHLRLWRAWRSSREAAFGEATMVELPWNHEDVQLTDPTLTADRLLLAFCSNRTEGSVGTHDIWFCTRESLDGVWSAPVNAGHDANSAANDFEPELSHDGLSLFFHSDRTGGHGGTDLWISRRRTRAEPFGPAKNLGAEINGPGDEGGAALAGDGLTLLFHRVLDAGTTIWMTHRSAPDQPFARARPLVLKGPPDARAPAMSSDGRELFLSALSAGEPRNMDLWRSLRLSQTISAPAADPKSKLETTETNPR
jgi:tRNA A-37 threonylcarbamoyl transferase component Bud32